MFNDGCKEDGNGTMTSTTLSGLGLAKDLDFGPTYSSGNPQTFGEPAIFPGGIGFGTVQFVDGKFPTDGAKSTIEVVNLLLGIGNDSLDIQGTLDPDVAVKMTGTIIITADRGTGIDLTRPQPFDWKAQGFLVGQPVHISGFPGHDLDGRRLLGRRTRDTKDNTVMHLGGPVPTAGQLTGVGQVTTMKTVANVTTGGGAFGGSLTRAAATGSPTGSRRPAGHDLGARVVDGAGRHERRQDAAARQRPDAPLGRQRDQDGHRRQGHAADDDRRRRPGHRDHASHDRQQQRGRDPQRWRHRHPLDRQLGHRRLRDRAVGHDPGHPGHRLAPARHQPDGKTLTLGRGSPLPGATSATRTVFVPGPHGGLTLVHGGGNLPLDTTFDMTVGANSITRNDGLSWAADGYARFYANGLPMHIQVVAQRRRARSPASAT